MPQDALYVLGIDPGFAAVGYSLLRLYESREEVIQLGVLRTKKSAEKKHIYASEENVLRAQELSQGLIGILDSVPVIALCAEAMSYPRNASASAKVAMCWGILATLTAQRRIPILQLSPQAVKKAVSGARDASKETVQGSLEKRYGDVTLKRLLGKVAPSFYEHAYDSLAVAVACLDSEVIRLVRRISPCAD